MTDVIHLGAAVLNVAVAILILAWAIIGARYFKEGLLVKTMRRLMYTSILLLLHFLAIALVANNSLPNNTSIDDLFGVFFMIALFYTTYSFTNDWRKIP